VGAAKYFGCTMARNEPPLSPYKYYSICIFDFRVYNFMGFA
jgi:hypothetical protein